jgi:hypothetical protein
MDTGERSPALFHRMIRLAQKMRDKVYRDAYVASHTRQFLARQMRAFRGKKSQAEFGKEIDRNQVVISRLENPNYTGWTVQTLLDVAAKQDRAVIIRFVDFPTFLRYTEDQSEDAACPKPYDAETLEQTADTVFYDQYLFGHGVPSAAGSIIGIGVTLGGDFGYHTSGSINKINLMIGDGYEYSPFNIIRFAYPLTFGAHNANSNDFAVGTSLSNTYTMGAK